MVFKLFRTPRRKEPTAAIPAGQRVYAIGDIHGRADLLEELLALIDADDAQRSPAEPLLILLGDLIDRGPQSAQVVERLREIAEGGARMRLLLGNHEEVFLMALRGNVDALKFLIRIGGDQTLFSYGITIDEYQHGDYRDLLAIAQARVPENHLTFLESFEDMIEIGDYAFVHAGVDPERPLDDQQTSDLRWIRGDFLNYNRPLAKIVVHGHTIARDVEVMQHRIGLDTGAWQSGTLTAMGFEGDQRWVLQTGRASALDAA